MISVEERVTYLDTIMAELARAQVQSEIEFKASGARMDALVRKMEADTERMKEEMARIIAGMEADTARMKEHSAAIQVQIMENSAKVEAQIKDNSARVAAEIKQNSASVDARMEAATAQMKADTANMKKVWGDLANKMGTVAEDVVAPNIPRLAVEEFGFSEVQDLMVRAYRASRRGEKRRTEWDVVCSGPGKVIVVEVKSTPTLDKIREVPGRLSEFFDFFPEYAGRELIGIFASWAIAPQLLPAISAAGLYGIAMGEDTMDIVARPAQTGLSPLSAPAPRG